MKIAISSHGKELDDQVNPRFGRTDFIVIVDSETEELVKVIDNNANMAAAHGAGLQAAQSVAQEGVEWVLTGNVGPNAHSILTSSGIKIGIGATGTIRETLTKFKEGGFSETSSPSSGGHGGGRRNRF